MKEVIIKKNKNGYGVFIESKLFKTFRNKIDAMGYGTKLAKEHKADKVTIKSDLEVVQ